METQIITLHEDRNVTLTVYRQAIGGEFSYVTKRPAVLILPGGGYQMCSDREADPVAFPYLQAGYHVFILRYSVREYAQWPTPLEDYEEAMSLIRGKAETWAVDPEKIAVIGFSAGGHLAGCAATMSRNRPNAAVLGYPVLMGEHARVCSPTAPDVISAVDRNTCPCFVFATRTDQVVPIENSLRMLLALTKAGVSFESHIYAYGPHGFSTGDPSVQNPDDGLCSRAPGWVADSIGWLEDTFGRFQADGFSQPRYRNPDNAPFLCADCTIGRLMDVPAAAELLRPLLAAASQDHPIEGIAKRISLRSALGFAKVPDTVVAELDEKLSKIPNK